MTVIYNSKEITLHICAIQYFRKVLNFMREDHSFYYDGLLSVEVIVLKIGIKIVNDNDV
jgi:hypothetical protein